MSNKPEWLSALGALLLTGLTAYATHHSTSTGEVPIPKEFLIDISVLVALLVSWLVYWLIVYICRDMKREKVRHAKEMGRKICPCTETGEIMIHITRQQPGRDQTYSVLHCPKCKVEEIYDPVA